METKANLGPRGVNEIDSRIYRGGAILRRNPTSHYTLYFFFRPYFYTTRI